MGRKRIRSIHDFTRWKLEVCPVCKCCGRAVVLSSLDLARRYTGLTLWSMRRRFRCKACGGRPEIEAW